MFKQIKVRLYPTKSQADVLDLHLDGYRFAYNLALEYKNLIYKDYGKRLSKFDLQKELLEVRKGSNWLIKCKAECIREAASTLDKTFDNYFNQLKDGTIVRQQKKYLANRVKKGLEINWNKHYNIGKPKFKAKKGRQSFIAQQSIYCQDNRLTFYKNKVKFKTSKNFSEILETTKIKKCTFIKDLCGDYWATFLVDVNIKKDITETTNTVGIDLGIKDLVITSEGKRYENKKFLETNYFKLRRMQRKFSKTKKEGKNREKLRVKIAKVYRKTNWQKEHYYHQITNELIRENQTIVMETLGVKEMIESKKMSRSIADASWGRLTQMLEYKCKWYGRELIKINQYYPSSKTCSNCGNVKDSLLLSERTYKCNVCNVKIDRDLNAAINIKNAGIKIPGVTVEDMVSASAYEAVIINNLN